MTHITSGPPVVMQAISPRSVFVCDTLCEPYMMRFLATRSLPFWKERTRTEKEYFWGITIMENRRERYILLQDRVGSVQERSMLSFGLLVKQFTPTHLLKGELMEALPETEQPNDSTRIALAGINRKNSRLVCRTDHIARLTIEDSNLLLAISSAGLRYWTYINRKRLDFGRQIVPGKSVFLEVKGFSKKLHGVVRYTGELPSLLGTMFGVELIVSICLLLKYVDEILLNTVYAIPVWWIEFIL